jgi:hypothetical protein
MLYGNKKVTVYCKKYLWKVGARRRGRCMHADKTGNKRLKILL